MFRLIILVGYLLAVELFGPSRQAGLAAEDNLICNKSCFVDVENNDFSAAKDSSLERRRVGYTAGWLPADDFFNQRRKNPPKPGAVESAGRANMPKLQP